MKSKWIGCKFPYVIKNSKEMFNFLGARLKKIRLKESIVNPIKRILTEIPDPLYTLKGYSGSLSTIRTGTPFFNKVRASTNPEGPAPTC